MPRRSTLLSGELVFQNEHGEVTLQAGDTIVVRGGRHAWSNRSDDVAVLSAVSVGHADAAVRHS